MKLYFPESYNQIDDVGYNHAVSLFNKVLGEYITNDPTKADYRVYCNLPYYDKPKELKTHGLPLLVYTMYESTKVPKSWVKFLNKHSDIVLVPSIWCKEVFINSGVKKPIHVLSLCYDDSKIKFNPKTKNTDEYNFLWQGVALDRFGRKGYDIAIRAFKELKNDNLLGDDCNLILKVKPWKDRPVEINTVKSSSGVIYIQENIKRQELIDLYSAVDCCINPTHGEGFGLIPLEQMAMGKPVLVTNWSMPYIDEQICVPLKYTLKKSCIFFNHKFLTISRNGIAFNFGGLYKDLVLLPKLLTLKPDGKKVIAVSPFKIKLTLKDKILNRSNNFLRSVQIKFNLFFNYNNKKYLLFAEDPGLDAYVNIEYLKNKMLYCYNNKSLAEDLGFMASEVVKNKWSSHKMLNDFKKLIPILEKYKKEL